MSFPYVTDVANAIFGTQWSLPVPVFGVVVLIAVFWSTLVFRKEVARYEARGVVPGGTAAVISDLVFVGVLAGIVGARIFHLLEYTDQFLAQPASMIFTRNGFSIYGGLCFGILAAVVFLQRRRVPVLPMLDAAAPAMMLGYAIGRLGCQLSGDGDWGIPADFALKPHWLPDWLWAQTYENNIAGIAIPPPGVYPTPLYETAMALILAWLLWTLRSHRHRAGFLFSLYLIFAGFERLLIEKIRVNARYTVFDFAVTQAEAISCVLVVAGCMAALVTLKVRGLLPKAIFTVLVLTTLSACVCL
ncbi:MAG TPA: prolipoprotein diacylglyceryl transferase family protein [Steroidobacteraceae bacterium]|nr:prolipoprotein diacylglyceryl transferase family protein [Steroidobacteraceae bacterium]